MELANNVDALRTLGYALATSGAMACLTELRYGTVVSDEEGSSVFAILRVLTVHRHAVFVHTLVEVGEDSRNIDAIRTRHAILAIVAWDERIAHELLSGRIEEVHIFLRQWFEWRVCFDVLLQVFHVRHTAKHAEYMRMRSGKTESPRCYR